MIDPSDQKQIERLYEIVGMLVMMFLLFTYCGGTRLGDSLSGPRAREWIPKDGVELRDRDDPLPRALELHDMKKESE